MKLKMHLPSYFRQTLAALLLTSCTAAQADPVQVMVLGSYHFANPGLDLYNARSDDVLSARRQAELAALSERLAGFRPTLVAVEARADDQPGRALPAYARYLAGQDAPSRNEIEQIGFRLAKALQLPQVVGIDAPGEFPFEPLQTYTAKVGRSAELQRSLDELGKKTQAFEALSRTASIGALLRHINRPEAIHADHGWYMQALRHGAGSEQPGAELLGRWMMRNAAICARLVQTARAGDRVLVLYGSGHNHLLRRCVRQW